MIAVVVQLKHTHTHTKATQKQITEAIKKTSCMINYDPEHNVKVTTIPVFFLTIKVKSKELECDTRVSSKQGRGEEKKRKITKKICHFMLKKKKSEPYSGLFL